MNNKLKFTIRDTDGARNRQVEIEGYKKNNLSVISFSKLRAFFEMNKQSYGLDYQIKFCDSKLSPGGGVAHAFTCITLKDNNNYINDFIGEITDAEMDSDISRNHPLCCALNRAMSAGLIAYFGFGEKVYTTAQLNYTEVQENASEETKE